jgi:multisubunit Na+/H+ antiporter MnhG subunit
MDWAQRLLFLAVVFIPFQQALTVEVGFPLKISEILAGAGVVTALVIHRARLLSATGARLVVALLGIVLASSVWTAVTTDGTVVNAAYPQGMLFDLIQYTAYAGLALAVFLGLSSVVSPDQVSVAVGWAVRLAAVYVVIQLVAWLAGAAPLLELVNGNMQWGRQYGVEIPRNGPMREGNYFGLFAAAAACIAMRARDLVGLGVALILVLYSQSTGALLGIISAVLAVVILRPTRRKLLIVGGGLVAAVVAVLVIPPVNRMAVGQLTKLGLIPNQLGPAYEYSLRARSANAETGFAMAVDNPAVGVGQGRYASRYLEYLDLTGLPSNFGTNNVRPIANNVYAQLGAETGLIALAILVALLGLLLWRARRESDGAVALVTVIAVGLMAFPAWTNLMAWTMIAAAATYATATRKGKSGQADGADAR